MSASNNSPSDGLSHIPLECQQIEQLLSHPLYLYQMAGWFQIVTLLAIFTLIGCLGRVYKSSKIQFHGNLMILISNAIFFYMVTSLPTIIAQIRYKLLYSTHTNAFDLLTPVWLLFTLILPNYFYLIANTGIHFMIMLERIRATRFVRHYETEGTKYGILGCLLVWFLAISYTFLIFFTALADTATFSKPLGLPMVTTKYNSQLIMGTFPGTLCMALITAAGDYFVVKWNRRKIQPNNRQETVEYSLSRNYQLNENNLSMSIIFPLDTSYAIIFGIYMIVCLWVRYVYSIGQIDAIEYSCYYALIMTLPSLHSAITLLIYILFIRNLARKRRQLIKVPTDHSGQLYFKELKHQWQYIPNQDKNQ